MTLYDYTLSLLEATNPFSTPVSEINYSLKEYSDTISICSCLRNTEEIRCNLITRSKKENNKNALNAISDALSDYLEEYPASFSFKQHLRDKFYHWLLQIQDTNSIKNVDLSNWKVGTTDRDIAVALLKELHDQQGKTLKELKESVNLTERAIHKNLRRLDPSLLKSGEGETERYSIGGYPVNIKITAEGDPGEAVRYKTVNTLHPIILQENITQTAALLEALSVSYHAGNAVCLSTALDIWYQLSEYAQNRMTYIFARGNADFTEFLDILKDDSPDSHLVGFSTEREMIREYDCMTKDFALRYVMKVPTRRGDLFLKQLDQEICLPNVRFKLMHKEDGKHYYAAISEDGETTLFTMDEVTEIRPNIEQD